MTASPTLVSLYGGPLDGESITAPKGCNGCLIIPRPESPKDTPATYVACDATSRQLGRPAYRHTLTRIPGTK